MARTPERCVEHLPGQGRLLARPGHRRRQGRRAPGPAARHGHAEPRSRARVRELERQRDVRDGAQGRAVLDGREVALALVGEHRRAVRAGQHAGGLPGRGERAPHPGPREASPRPARTGAPREAVGADDAQRQRPGDRAPGAPDAAYRAQRSGPPRAAVRNPATLAKAPRLVELEVEPYTVDEVRLLLKAAMGGRNGARWAIALALGLRQGEALGLNWSDVDLDAGTLIVRRGRLRPRWRHGCDGTCGRKFGGHCPQRIAERAGDRRDQVQGRASRRRAASRARRAARAARDRAGPGTRHRGPALDGTTAGCSPRRPADRSTRAPTGRTGRSCSPLPGYGTGACTTPGTPPPRCCCCSAFRSAPSWASWAGRTPRWPRDTSTSRPRSSATSPPASAA